MGGINNKPLCLGSKNIICSFPIMTVYLLEQILVNTNATLILDHTSNYILWLILSCGVCVSWYMINCTHEVYLKLIYLNIWNIWLAGGTKYILSPETVTEYKQIIYCGTIITSFVLLNNFIEEVIKIKKELTWDLEEKVLELNDRVNEASRFNRFRLVSSFVVVLTLLVCLYPRRLLLKSNCIYSFNDEFDLYYDHIYISLIAACSVNYLINFHNLINYPNNLKISRLSTILIEIGWLYNWFVLLGTFFFMIVSSNVLANSYTSVSPSFIIQWFDCSSDASFSNSFIDFYLVMINCWIVLIFHSFSLFPGIIWLLLKL